MRNKRAHDNPLSSREAYRLADSVQQFFEIPKCPDVVKDFYNLRLEALDLHYNEEKDRFLSGSHI